MFHVDREEDGRWPGGSNDQQDMALPLLVRDTENKAAICQPPQNRITAEENSYKVQELTNPCSDIQIRKNVI